MQNNNSVGVFDADCPLCRLALWDKGFPGALKTELIFQDERVTIVIDLNPKGYEERLLAVTRLGHIPCSELDPVEVKHLKSTLRQAVWKRWGRNCKVTYDYYQHTISDHEHFQAGLTSWTSGSERISG